MGYKIEINWVLKLAPYQLRLGKESLVKGCIYEFEKNEERIYPVNIPIELVDENWIVLAEISILEVTIGSGKTKGKYKVLAIPTEKRRSIYSKYILPT